MSKRITRSVAIVMMESLTQDTSDPEVMHANADEILLSYVPVDVRSAYEAVKEAAGWWAHA